MFRSQIKPLQWAVMFAVLFYFLHMIALPVSMTYDGVIYVHLAEILGTTRFPAEWTVPRTPLFPLLLKLSFWLLGRQPLAVIFLSSTLGLFSTLLLGRIAVMTAGRAAGVVTLVVISLYPTYIAYQHFALTEAGSSFFLVGITALLIWTPQTGRSLWGKAFLLMVFLTGAWHWRQALLFLAPVVAIIYGADNWRNIFGRLGGNTALRVRPFWGGAFAISAQLLLIGYIPFVLAKPWQAIVHDEEVAAIMIDHGILRQVLIPPEDPFIGNIRDDYRNAIDDSLFEGNFYSGLRPDLLRSIQEKLSTRPYPEPHKQFFWHSIQRYPGRYFQALGRTLVLFAGAKAQSNENHPSTRIVLSPENHWISRQADGPPDITPPIRADLTQYTKPNAISGFLWTLAPAYYWLVQLGSLISLLGLICGLILRERSIVIITVVPLVYLFFAAVLLVSIDRYAFPAYPAIIANIFLVPILAIRRIRDRLGRTRLTVRG